MSKKEVVSANLQQIVLDQLNAGTLLMTVVEPDEALATEACRMAAEAIATRQTQVVSVLDEDFADKLQSHKDDGKGVMIVSDLLRVQGNPGMGRALREFALQVKENPPYPRIILIETPGVEIPPGLKGDIEYIETEPPGPLERMQELEQFLTDQSITLKGNGEEKASLCDSVAGLPRHSIARLFARCYVENKELEVEWLRNAKAKMIKEQSGKALSFVVVGDETPTVGGSENMAEWLRKTKKTFTSKKARDYGTKQPRGLLIVGVPGTGKSLTPKNIGRDWGSPLIRLDLGLVFGSLVGQSEAQMHQTLKAIESCAPCILWVDEIEKALGGMKGSGGDGGVGKRVLGAFLTWLQDCKAPIFVVATANEVTDLRPELLRAGRFDGIFFVDLPDVIEREAIAKIHLKKKARDINGLKDIDAKELAVMTEGYTGAEIEQVIVEALKIGFDEDRKVSLGDIAMSVKEVTPISVTMPEDITNLRNWAKNKAKFANKRVKKNADTPTGKVTRAKLTSQDKK